MQANIASKWRMALAAGAITLGLIILSALRPASADELTEEEYLGSRPPAPIHLTAVRHKGSVRLCWQGGPPPANAHYDRRVRYFRIYRMRSLVAPYMLIGKSRDTCFIDSSRIFRRASTYTVTAVQGSGEESEASEPVTTSWRNLKINGVKSISR
jgi:hypothetical protein